MRTFLKNTFLAALLLTAFASPTPAADFFFHDGDRVVFLGDSITEQKLYTTYIEAYTVTRFPHWQITFRNAGWSGDTSWLSRRHATDSKALFAADEQTQQRLVNAAVTDGLARDVLPLKPTVVTIDFGMNDHGYQPFREDIFRAYVRSQTRLVQELVHDGARVALLTPQPIEEHRPDPDKDVRNQSLRKFADGLKQVAADQGALFVDQFNPYMGVLLHERAANTNAFVGGGDAIHPGPQGHTIMAWAILKGLGAPALVSRADVDASKRKLIATERCAVTDLRFADGSVSFNRLDESLPMPVAAGAEGAAKLVPLFDDLNRYELKVTGLSAARYTLSVDSQSVGEFTKEDLAAGHNLATANGPITKQAQEVLKLVFAKNEQFFQRWRNVQLFNFPDWAKGPELEARRTTELSRLDAQIAELESQILTACQPKSHHFELTPVTTRPSTN